MPAALTPRLITAGVAFATLAASLACATDYFPTELPQPVAAVGVSPAYDTIDIGQRPAVVGNPAGCAVAPRPRDEVPGTRRYGGGGEEAIVVLQHEGYGLVEFFQPRGRPAAATSSGRTTGRLRSRHPFA